MMRSGDAENIGNVDFDDDEGRTDDGLFTVHLMPQCDDEGIRVELHLEKGPATIEPNVGRPA
ncbi:hypothetical protein [Streptomyces sp. NPDC059970]|uniref:hypothetical protein n=1 Tax=Streptomyces sp. NPDC059970 TaxID=3347019 RepID=UPI0036B0CCAE